MLWIVSSFVLLFRSVGFSTQLFSEGQFELQANMEAPQIRPTLDESVAAGEAGTSSVSAGTVPRRPAPSKMNPAMAGVSGILRKEQEQQEEVDKNMKEAFQDLNGLMVCYLASCLIFIFRPDIELWHGGLCLHLLRLRDAPHN